MGTIAFASTCLDYEGSTMSKVEYLREQAARAERLASPALDALSVARLLAMSREYRSLADQFEDASRAVTEAGGPLPH